MLITFPENEIGDRAQRRMKTLCNFGLAKHWHQIANLAYLFIGESAQFYRAMIERFRALKCSSFIDCISYVVRLSTKEKMVWAHASGSVAVMKHANAFGNRTNVNGPTQAMSKNRLSLLIKDDPISTGVFRGSPQPTIFTFLNLAPKTFFKTLFHVRQYIRLAPVDCCANVGGRFQFGG